MNTKYFPLGAIFSFIFVSVAHASDGVVHSVVHREPIPVAAAPASFSWTGFYVGAQIGGSSGKSTINNFESNKKNSKKKYEKNDSKEILHPKLSGFLKGGYAGSNIDLADGFIVGVDTDFMWSGSKDTKINDCSEFHGPEPLLTAGDFSKKEVQYYTQTVKHTLKQKWVGATRLRIGFATDRVMPYFAGGVAYTQLRHIISTSVNEKEGPLISNTDSSNDKKVMVGYTVGAGADFAMTDNVVLRAEYRYSDFGKKKFSDDKVEVAYKTNDFRVGVAYKF
ncbi:outer membrane protein [Bartonella sp. F02]|uniref:outer membrane protein n=1 Tax=Bartonella sp. F02 TaxID=2967262 RepID=UPI0022A91B08|nr:outer membrane protein [Bartonella sp. F02]MCZ2328627.1 porin family protein [Bartonella sp. F02]